jgi:hypothetical protein
MSMFRCVKCDEIADSDDGCQEYGSSFGLMCIDCMNEIDEDEATYHTSSTPAQESARVERMRAEIREKLTKAGCPADIAEELAREKSK